MSKLAEFREKNPAYKDVPDEKLAPALHKKFYSNIPQEEFFKQVGFTPIEEPGMISRGLSALGDLRKSLQQQTNDYEAQQPQQQRVQSTPQDRATPLSPLDAASLGGMAAGMGPVNVRTAMKAEQGADPFLTVDSELLNAPGAFDSLKAEQNRREMDAFKGSYLEGYRKEGEQSRRLEGDDARQFAQQQYDKDFAKGDPSVKPAEASWKDTFNIGATQAGRGMARGFYATLESVGDMVGATDLAKYAAEDRAQQEEAIAGRLKASLGKVPEDGFKSIVGDAIPTIISQGAPIAAAALATVATRNPEVGKAMVSATVLAPMGVQSYGNAYADGKAQGLALEDRVTYGVGTALAEVLPERISLGYIMDLLTKPLKAGGKKAAEQSVVNELAKRFLQMQATEMTTEQVTTVSQFLLDRYYTNPDLSLKDLQEQMVRTALVTPVATTALGAAGAAGSMAGAAISGRPRDLTAGMKPDQAMIDALARQSLDPSNAQMAEVIPPSPVQPPEGFEYAQEAANVAPPLDAASDQGQGADPAGSAGLARDGGIGGAGAGIATGAPARSGEPGMAMGDAERQQVAGVVEQTIAQKEAEAAATGDPIELLVTQAEGAALRRAVTPQPTNGIDIDQDALLADVEAMFTDGGNLMVQGDNAREAVKRIDPKALASALPRGDGALLVPKRFAGPVMDALQGAKQRVSVAFGGDGMMQAPDVAQFRATVPAQEEVQNVPERVEVAAQEEETRGQESAQEAVDFFRLKPKYSAQPDISPDTITPNPAPAQAKVADTPKPKNLLQIVRQAGGVSTSRISDVTGDSKRPGAVGVFTKNGMDLDGLAELLQQNGFMTEADVSDTTSGAERATELLRQALAGERPVALDDIDNELALREEKKYRDRIRQRANELGIRTTARRFDAIEADVLAQEEQMALEAEDRSAYALDLGGYNEQTPAVQSFLDDAFDPFSETAAGQSTEEAMRALGFTEDEINAELQAGTSAQETGEADARGTEGGAASADPRQEGEGQGQQELDPLGFTPKQYHEAKLKWVAQEYGLPMSEVREMQDSEADRKASEQEWVNAVKQAFRDGRELTAKTLDKLEEVRPGAFNSFLHDHPEANVPQGYQTPEARQIEKQRAQERKDDRKAAKEERAKPMLQSNGKPFPSEKLAAESARQRKLDMVPVEVDGGWGLAEKPVRMLNAEERQVLDRHYAAQREYRDHRKGFLSLFTGQDLRKQTKFVEAAENAFMAGRIMGFRGGQTVEVANDTLGQGGGATVYMLAPSGKFLEVDSIPLAETQLYRKSEPLTLDTYTPADIAQREAEQAARAEDDAKAEREAAAKQRQAEERAEVRRRSEAAADTFELGMDPMENLTGQGDIFSQPAPQTAPQEDGDWLMTLFGEDAGNAKEQMAQIGRDEARKAKTQAERIKALRGAMDSVRKDLQAQYDDWAGRVYKKNKNMVELQGDGPSSQAAISVGSINENRRRRAMEALNDSLQAVGRLEKQIATDQGVKDMLRTLDRSMDRAKQLHESGNFTFLKSQDAAFEYILLDDALKMRPANGGSLTSNEISRAMLAFMKRDFADAGSGAAESERFGAAAEPDRKAMPSGLSFPSERIVTNIQAAFEPLEVQASSIGTSGGYVNFGSQYPDGRYYIESAGKSIGFIDGKWGDVTPGGLQPKGEYDTRNLQSETIRVLQSQGAKLAKDAAAQQGGLNFSRKRNNDAEYLAAVERGDMEAAQRMVDQAARDAGITRESLVQSISARFPSLTRAVESALRRGDEGKAGGVVVVERAEDLARMFAEKTGRSMDDAVQSLGSTDGRDVNGLFDSRSGLTFLVAPNLTERTAPAVLLHEATHGKQRAEIDRKAMELIETRQTRSRPLRDFLFRVEQRMDAAGESGNATEAAAYIVEEAVVAGRQAGFSAVDGKLMNWIDLKFGRRVSDIVRDFVAMIRAWAMRAGVDLNPTVDDLVAIAKLNVRDMARGDVTGGSTDGKMQAMSERSRVASEQAPNPAGDGTTGGATPLVTTTHPTLGMRVPVRVVSAPGERGMRFAIEGGQATLRINPAFASDRQYVRTQMANGYALDDFLWPFGDDVFIRTSDSAQDYDHIKAGTHRGSKNHATGETEGGISVSRQPAHAAGNHAYLVRGNRIGQGSDGEPLLDVASVRVASKRMSLSDAMEMLDDAIKERAKAMGLSAKELRALRTATDLDFSRMNEPPAPSASGAAFSRASQIASKAFRDWFGDSKVVDENGQPLVMYHGSPTPDALTEFQPGGGVGSRLSGDAYGVASYFTSSPGEASTYARDEGGAVLPVYLRGEILDLNGELTDDQRERLTRLANETLLPSDKARFEAGRKRRSFESREDAIEFFDSQRENWLAFGDGMDRARPDAIVEGDKFVVEYTDFDAEVTIETADQAATLLKAIGWDNLPAAGFDGVMMARSGGAKWVVMHRPDGNVKSATGNNGNFDPTDRRINFSRSGQATMSPPATAAQPAQATPPDETRFQAFQRKAQDKLNRFTVIKEWLAAQGVTLSEQADVYKAEERMHSRFANKAEDFREKTVKPLVEKIQRAGYSMDDVAQYLHAQHAEERNIQVASINKQMPDGGSGMKTADANAILAAAPVELRRLANEFRAITDRTKQILLDNGIISQDMADAWDAAYQHYVPLKGGPEQGGKGAGKGLKANYKGKRALGHAMREEGEWIVENILADHERAIMLAEKNRVGQSLLKMAIEVGRDDLLTVGKPEKRGVLKNNTAYEVLFKGKVIGSFQSLEAARAFRATAPAAMKGASPSEFGVRKVSDPTVAYMASPMLADNEVNVYVKGRAIRVQINDELLARAYGNMGTEALGAILRVGATINGYFSKIYTGYNPEFILTNIVRDFTTGVANVTGEEGAMMALRAAKDYPASFADLFRYATTGNASQWIRMYREDGGNTGAAYLSDLERLGDEISTEYAAYKGVLANLKAGDVKSAARAAGRKAFDKTLVWVERINQAGENAMRLSIYKAMIESGKSRAEAASLAKNATVNFNRNGEAGRQMNALWLFYNAGVQGTAAIAHANLKGRHKWQARAVSAGILGLGYTMAVALGAGDDEDDYDKLSDYTKARNVVIKTGDGWLKIPVPYGYGFFWNMGRAIADAERKGEWGKAPWHVASSFIEEFTPFGAAFAGDDLALEQITLGALPTLAQIPASVGMNRTTMGGPMYPESAFDKHQPDNEKMWRATKGTIPDMIAQALDQGGIEVSPETIKYLTRTFTGGAGTFVTSIADAAWLTANGASMEVKEVPFARKFYTATDVREARGAYYKAVGEAEKVVRKGTSLLKMGDYAAYQSHTVENQEMYMLDAMAKAYAKAIRASRDHADTIRTNKELGIKEKREQLKEIEDREQVLYDQYLGVFKSQTRK